MPARLPEVFSFGVIESLIDMNAFRLGLSSLIRVKNDEAVSRVAKHRCAI